jgi:hypothetical protein
MEEDLVGALIEVEVFDGAAQVGIEVTDLELTLLPTSRNGGTTAIDAELSQDIDEDGLLSLWT